MDDDSSDSDASGRMERPGESSSARVLAPLKASGPLGITTSGGLNGITTSRDVDDTPLEPITIRGSGGYKHRRGSTRVNNEENWSRRRLSVRNVDDVVGGGDTDQGVAIVGRSLLKSNPTSGGFGKKFPGAGSRLWGGKDGNNGRGGGHKEDMVSRRRGSRMMAKEEEEDVLGSMPNIPLKSSSSWGSKASGGVDHVPGGGTLRAGGLATRADRVAPSTNLFGGNPFDLWGKSDPEMQASQRQVSE